MSLSSRPALHGGLLAMLAAVLFGVSTPLVQRFGTGLGSFTTAALLYAGAALTGFLLRQPVQHEARVTRHDLPRLAWMALFGAIVGPVALAWGLQRTSAASGSLVLTLEAVFTVVLARLLYREALDTRVKLALLLLTLGGVALVLDQAQNRAQGGGAQIIGLAAVMLATAAWGVDNTLSRALADRDPGQVVMLKGALGATATTAIAWLWGDSLPQLWPAVALLAVGASGYGLSLRFYLLAQRAFGAARTGSVFAFAPFVGAALALAMGDRAGGLWMLVGAALMLAGIVLHLMESHAHAHRHEVLEHEHAHEHGDEHHNHSHPGLPTSRHSHRHTHEPLQHSHAHVPDEHHQHAHPHSH